MRQQHVPVDLRQAEAHGASGGFLAARQRLDAGAHLFADTRSGEQTQADDHTDQRRGGWIQVLFEPFLQIFRQQVGHQEVPDEQLHQQRHITKQFHVARGDTRYQTVRDSTHDAEYRTQQQRDDPGGDSNGDGPAQTGDVPVQIGFAAHASGLEEYAPVPVVIHRDLPSDQLFHGHLRASGGARRPRMKG
ncbi:hypothetical protein D9M71_590970 [compost metagenome]